MRALQKRVLKGVTMSIRILLADDHKLMREGIRTLVAEQPGMTVVAEAGDGASAVRLATELSPDIVIMDIAMPGLSGIEATRRLRETKTASKVIALSMHLERRMVLDMLEAGASGYLLKDCIFEEVVFAVRTVLSDCMYLSPRVVEVVLKDYVQRAARDELAPLEDLPASERKVLGLASEGRGLEEITALLEMSVKAVYSSLRRIIFDYIVPYFHDASAGMTVDPAVSLTTREREILGWIREGKSTWEISSILGLSRDTVKYHLKKTFQKLNATNRIQAIAVALDNKLIDL
jgi:two-component system response regulator NreC